MAICLASLPSLPKKETSLPHRTLSQQQANLQETSPDKIFVLAAVRTRRLLTGLAVSEPGELLEPGPDSCPEAADPGRSAATLSAPSNSRPGASRGHKVGLVSTHPQGAPWIRGSHVR